MNERLSHPLITIDRLARKAILYLRQSSQHQVDENEGSTDLQRAQAQLAQRYGWPPDLITVIDEDLGRRGVGTQHRSGWAELIRLVCSGQVGAVFAVNVGRLSRVLVDFAQLLALARDHDVALIIDSRPVDPSDPSDTFVLQVLAAFAQHDNETRARWLSRARRRKALNGTIVSRLPLGWIEESEDVYVKDPRLSHAIDDVYTTFLAMRSTLGTVRALDRAGKTLPVRHRKRIVWKRPSYGVVREFLTNPCYAGTYRFGTTENRPDLGTRPDGYPVRRQAPRSKWIEIPGRLPAYVTLGQQAEIRAILASNRFDLRHRAGEGPALCQGRLRCTHCGGSLVPQYPRKTTRIYACSKRSTTFGEPPCITVSGIPLDEAIERIFLRVMTAPPIEMLRSALAEACAAVESEVDRIAAERKRLEYEEQQARDRYENCDARNRLLAADLERRLEEAMQRRGDFEQRIASSPPPGPPIASENDLQEYCAIATDIPTLWRDPLVTNRDRKQLLGSLVDRIEVTQSEERVDAEIAWRSGATTRFFVWRREGLHRLIRELHDQGLSVRKIRERLADGDPRTGQRWLRTKGSIYLLLKKWGVRPNAPKRSPKSRNK